MPDNRAESGDDPRLHVLPVQVIEVDDGVLLARGSTQVRLTGRGAFDVVADVLTALQPPGRPRSELLAAAAGPERAKLGQLLDLLVARRLVVPSEGAPPLADPGADAAEDVFFWDFGLAAADVRARFAERRVHVAGVNRLGVALAEALGRAGFTDLALIDAPLLRNLALFDDAGALRPGALPADAPAPIEETAWRGAADAGGDGRPDLLVVTSDFGGKALFRPWNEWAVGAGVAFFPVVLQQLVGSIGPYVQPYETPCYECVRGRENANMDDPAAQRALESMAFEGQFATGAHPLMPAMVAQHAAFELTKLM
ncbi:MAG: hypothetical protein GVY28_13985, partial [Alphaproteobacteria bacterium]|nr:hypothetical protein [Alphaproteobacteria bacterium]